jgi:hypothetical protein
MSTLETTLQTLAQRLQSHAGAIATEEALKTSVVLPFLSALGYDVFDPSEVIPEFTADAVGKKGEKVDYAIKHDGAIKILVECKGLTTKLDRVHLAQLFRYFTVTTAKFAILTNGRSFQFHSDIDEPNKLDARPFFTFDLLDFSQANVAELQKFEKASFNVENILATAERLKYVSAVKGLLVKEVESPSEDLVRLIAPHVYEGRVNAQVRELISDAIRGAFRELIRDNVRARLSSALDTTVEPEQLSARPDGEGIETTQEELEGFLTVKAIVRDAIDTKRIYLRDAKYYCAILVDDSNRKPLARLHFNRAQKYLSLFDGDKEERVQITDLDDLYTHSARLRATAEKYPINGKGKAEQP